MKQAVMSRVLQLSLLTAAAISSSGCSVFEGTLRTPATLGEQNSNYGYIPVDALSVRQVPQSETCDSWYQDGPNGALFSQKNYRPLLESLPDLSVRFAVASFTQNAGLNFGPSKVTVKGQVYRAVLDYVNVDVVPRDFWIRLRIEGLSESFYAPPGYQLKTGEIISAYEVEAIDQFGSYVPFDETGRANQGFQRVTIPVYVGVGLRLTADIIALEGNINLASLGAIGAEAQANNLSGTLTVQTLGINGSSVATALPLPSKLDQTTIENALLSLGSSRAILFSNGEGSQSNATARVVGIYSPIGSDPRLVNRIYSELSRESTHWRRPCQDRPIVPAVGARPNANTPTESWDTGPS